MAAAGCFEAGEASSGSRATPRRRGRRRPLLLAKKPPWRLVLAFLILMLVVPSCCQATARARGMQPFRGRPLMEPGSANRFLGFFPRGPVPPSGPSRQHNSIGAQDQSHP
jgi:hypothetical protein